MSSSTPSDSLRGGSAPAKQVPDDDCRVISKMGGRHLIFRGHRAGVKVLPRPCVLISPFQGPVWIFYGLGQVWLTHRKAETYSGWRARVPRFGATPLIRKVERLRWEIEQFIDFCNQHGIEGTLLFESGVVEFHWVFGFELEEEKGKPEHADQLHGHFLELARRYDSLEQNGT